MTSLRQIEANRRKAINSTGPRTPEGKAGGAQRPQARPAVARTAGPRRARGRPVRLRRRLRACLAPADELELLVDRIVAAAWRVRRLGHVEAALLDQEEQPADAFGHHGREKMLVLSRYEGALERSLHAAMRELERLRAASACATMARAAPLIEADPLETA